MNHRRPSRSHAAPPPSAEAVQSKLWQIIARHEQLKVAFHQLHSQIRTGLLEAEDVLASLAVPLTKLVGIKTVEMAAQGRLSTIVTSIDRLSSQVIRKSLQINPIEILICSRMNLPTLKSMKLSDVEEEDYMNRAMKAGNELMEKQKLQLMQLISLLKKIEAHVNASQNSIFQNLADHKAFIKRYFCKAFTYVSAIHPFSQSNDLSHMMLKILKATFDQVGVALGSVGVGVDGLISELAEKMCNPMVEYVNDLKVEMRTGTCSRLLEVVKEMDRAMKDRNFKLEEAQKQARLAEQSRIEALSKLKNSEETARKMMTSLGLVTEHTIHSEENLTQKMFLGRKEDQAKDDNILWELLREKRKCQVPESPLGLEELLGRGTCHKKLNSTRVISSLSHRPVTRSQSKRPNLQPSLINSRMLLGSSPSATTQKPLPGKRRTP